MDRCGQISVSNNRYSVPVHLIGLQVRVPLHASELIVYDGRTEVGQHERLVAGGVRRELDHYLEALLRKPGATAGAGPRRGKFTPVHNAWWEADRAAHGDAEGTRALIEVLLLHRHMPHEHEVAEIAAALKAGALASNAVALEARKVADADRAVERPEQPTPSRRLADRPPPSSHSRR
ncbi:hypothetical protein [Streptomyces sp. NPDC005760]|uniref:Mu transposase domain-containing protein n=1 Tax=Streptomyces sp. NPDC005760 TaxID=3156718 RepID=UPI0033CEAB0B